MDAARDVGHGRTQPLAGEDDIVDRRRRRKNAGEERVQRAAVICVAWAGVRMCASVVAMTAGTMCVSVVPAGLVMTGMRNGGAGSRAGLRQRRRDDAGKLGKHEQRDQCADKARYRPEPLHQCFARDHGATKAAASLRVSGSVVDAKHIPPIYDELTELVGGGEQGHYR